MGSARRRLVRNLLGSLVVLGIIGAIAVGLPLLNRVVPAGRTVGVGEPYTVAGRVSVVPPQGARLDVTRTRPGPEKGTALFVRDSVRYVLVVAPFDGNLDAAAARLRRKITETAGYQVTGVERAVQTRDGVPGLRGTYASPGRSGQYAIFVANGIGVEVTLSAPDPRGLADFESSLHSVSFGAAPAGP